MSTDAKTIAKKTSLITIEVGTTSSRIIRTDNLPYLIDTNPNVVSWIIKNNYKETDIEFIGERAILFPAPIETVVA